MEDSFRNRETQFESKFAHDEELRFKIIAHRNKLFAAWVAGEMGAAAPADYARGLNEFAFGKTSAALVAQALADLQGHGVTTTDVKIWKALEQAHERSEHEVTTESGAAD